MATYLDDMRQGDDYVIKLDYGTGNNITGFEFWLTIKAAFDDIDASAILQYSTIAGSNADDDPANGVAYMIVPSATTKLAESGNYYYDLQVKTTAGQVWTLIPPVDDYKDKLLIAPEVTRATV